jgi:hypothetical protein
MPTTTALVVARAFPPLSVQLGLKNKVPWTEWVEEEACQLAITTSSYQITEERFYRLTGAAISDTTIWRVAGVVGEAMLGQLVAEEAVSNAPVTVEEPPGVERVPADDPLIGQQANVSMDGTTICVREEGWKEVKGVTVSAVAQGPRRQGHRRPRTKQGAEPRPRPSNEPEVHLTRHSYRMRLAEADAFALVQGTEADRRRVQYAAGLSCVHDGGPWIWRISGDYYPEAVEILDWAHGIGNVSKVAQAAFGEGSTEAAQWRTEVESLLWQSEVEKVFTEKWPELPRRRGQRGNTIRNGREYLQTHQERMRYQDFREQGYPIGSGSMESACKNVVAWRMKRGGARWARGRVDPMLSMLGEYHSGRWSEMWRRIQQAECA